MSEGKPGGGGGCPMGYGGGGGPSQLGATDLTYNSYLKIPEMLALQIPQSEPAHHDEMLFIVIHQAYELWFKLILHEMDQAVSCMQADQVLRARHFLQRIVEVQKLLVKQIHLLETMTPVEFLEFRDRLMPASGFQSTQFRELEFAAGLRDEGYLNYFKSQPEQAARLRSSLAKPDLGEVFYALLARKGYAIPPRARQLELAATPADAEAAKRRDQLVHELARVYQEPEKDLPLYLLAESLVEFDEYLALWREHHVRVVERVIGFKAGTGGSSGVQYLRSTLSKKAFPALWEVRGVLKKGAP